MQDPACELPRTPLRDCPKSPSGVHNSALGATETMLFGPFWPPYTGQIHAQSVASTLFGQSQRDCPKSLGGGGSVALQSAEKSLSGPICAPNSGKIQGWSVARNTSRRPRRSPRDHREGSFRPISPSS